VDRPAPGFSRLSARRSRANVSRKPVREQSLSRLPLEAIASYAMSYRWSFNMKDGSVLSADGSWMCVFRKFEDGWKVVHSAGAHVYS
jgi:hypothetical protein